MLLESFLAAREFTFSDAT